MEINGSLRNVVRRERGEDSRSPCLYGQVYGDTKGRFRDGEYITTSTILEEGAGDIFKTRYSVYRVESWREDVMARKVVEGVNDNRKGDFLQTYTGKQYYPLDPHAEDVCIEDIAHSLSLQCRYAGHVKEFYSVAEHSVHIARWLFKYYGRESAKYGLLHDATEAYLVDVPRPVKPSLTNYKAIEAANWSVIAERFGLVDEMPECVHVADNRIIGDELVNMRCMEWHENHNNPLNVQIECWSPKQAEQEFLNMYCRLFEEERMVAA